MIEEELQGVSLINYIGAKFLSMANYLMIDLTVDSLSSVKEMLLVTNVNVFEDSHLFTSIH